MGAQPGLPGSQFQGEDALVRRIADLERSVQQLAAANPFTPMGMKPIPGGVEIQGTLSLPSGIINNDALANPVTGAVASGQANGFPVPGGSSDLGTIITKTIVVPAGFTKALVIANADMTAYNSTGTADYAFLRLRVAGQSSTYIPGGYTPPGTVGFVSASNSRLLEGLGGSFTITADAGSGNASWAATPDDNTANLNALITFLR